jgi:Flp pilus assembly protein TadD
MTFIRLWNWAGGDIPGALWPLLFFLALWPLFILRVIKPIGVFRDRSPLPWISAGMALLVALHLVIRHSVTPPRPDALLCWPPNEETLPGSAAAFSRLEDALRPGAARQELRWHGKAAPLLITQHLLGPDRHVPATQAETQAFMEALDLRLLLSAIATGKDKRVVLWRLEWGQCTIEDEEAIAAPAAFSQVEAALIKLARRQFTGMATMEKDWQDSHTVLYGAVQDSASLWLRLPQGELPPRAFLRRSSLILALDGPTAQVAPLVEKAIALAQSAPELGAEPWVLAGDWFARAGQWEEARQAVANALSLEAAHPLIFWQLGHMAPTPLKSFGFTHKADAYAACVQRQPAFLPAVMELGRELSLLRKSGQALPAVDRALACYPRSAELWLLRGNLCWEILDHDGSRRAWEESARLRPQDHRAWLNLGQLKVGQRRFREAVAPLERAVSLGSPPIALHLLGLAHGELGDLARARHYLQRRLDAGGTLEELAGTQRLLKRISAQGTTQ